MKKPPTIINCADMTEYAEAQKILLDTGWADIKWGCDAHRPNTKILVAKADVYSKDSEVSVVVYTTPVDEVYDENFCSHFVDNTLKEFFKHVTKMVA